MRSRLRARFRFLTALQVVLLLPTALLLTWSLLATTQVAVPVVAGFVLLLQVVFLLRYVQNHVDALQDFFSAVNYEDLTRRFVEDDLDAELKAAFNRVIARFQEARAERDLQAVYLETVVRHVPVPFMVAGEDGTLTLVNNPAKKLTGLSSLTRLSELAAVDPALPQKMQAIPAGQQLMLQTKLRGVPAELRVSASEIRLDGRVERLYSIENLSGELTAREASAWRNLIRVLTHEIMNTLTPVSSLAETAKKLLDQEDGREDIRDAVGTIARRSEGLMHFVSRYRELLKVPQPELRTVNVSDAFDAVLSLLGNDLKAALVEVSVVPQSLQVDADAQLLHQVLVNLARNALDAVEGRDSPRIGFAARLEFGRVILSVEDNGAGISDDALDQVFVPFYTTKRDGNGIGLSLSKQIMTAHGGEIVVDRLPQGTRFALVF